MSVKKDAIWQLNWNRWVRAVNVTFSKDIFFVIIIYTSSFNLILNPLITLWNITNFVLFICIVFVKPFNLIPNLTCFGQFWILTLFFGPDLLWPWPLTQMTTNAFKSGLVRFYLSKPFIWYQTWHVLDNFEFWPNFWTWPTLTLTFDLLRHISACLRV